MPKQGVYLLLAAGAGGATIPASTAAAAVRQLRAKGCDVHLSVRPLQEEQGPAIDVARDQMLSRKAGSVVRVLPPSRDPAELALDVRGADLVLMPDATEAAGRQVLPLAVRSDAPALAALKASGNARALLIPIDAAGMRSAEALAQALEPAVRDASGLGPVGSQLAVLDSESEDDEDESEPPPAAKPPRAPPSRAAPRVLPPSPIRRAREPAKTRRADSGTLSRGREFDDEARAFHALDAFEFLELGRRYYLLPRVDAWQLTLRHDPQAESHEPVGAAHALERWAHQYPQAASRLVRSLERYTLEATPTRRERRPSAAA